MRHGDKCDILDSGGQPVVRLPQYEVVYCTLRRRSRDSASSASPVITIPLTKLQRTGTYLKGAIDAARARTVLPMDRLPFP